MSLRIDELYERLPHVEREWARQTMTELALRDVNGENIGAALLEVESHMAEHGGHVREVFGDPQVYAAALELPETERLSGAQWAGAWLPALLLFAGTSVLLNAVLALFGGGGLPALPFALMLVVLAATAVAVVRFDLLRIMVQRPVLSAALLALLLGGGGILAALVPGPTVELSPWVAFPVGTALIASAVLLLLRMRRRAESQGIRLPSP